MLPKRAQNNSVKKESVHNSSINKSVYSAEMNTSDPQNIKYLVHNHERSANRKPAAYSNKRGKAFLCLSGYRNLKI